MIGAGLYREHQPSLGKAYTKDLNGSPKLYLTKLNDLVRLVVSEVILPREGLYEV